MGELDEILTVGEVAALLRIHRKTVYKFLKANELQGHRFGRIWRFKRSEIMKLLEQSNASLRDDSVSIHLSKAIDFTYSQPGRKKFAGDFCHV